MTTYTRRLFLQRSGAAAAGLAAVGVLSRTPAFAASDPIRDNLIAAFSSPAGTDVRRQVANLLTDPSMSGIVSFLESQPPQSLTGFQKASLAAASEILPNSDALQALLTGSTLTKAQSTQLTQLKADLHNNPAIQLLNSKGAQFKGSSGLQSAVNEYVTNLTTPFTPVPPGGGPAIDAFDAAYAVLRSSSSFGQYAATLTPLMQDPSFLSVLQGSPPHVVASYIPASQAWGLLLPNDHDPSVTDIVNFFGGVVVLTLGTIVAILTLPADAVLLLGLVLLGFLVALGVLEFDFLATIDCDHDGDPWDSNDVVGNEC
jgi:hypothetical protein